MAEFLVVSVGEHLVIVDPEGSGYPPPGIRKTVTAGNLEEAKIKHPCPRCHLEAKASDSVTLPQRLQILIGVDKT